MNIKLVLATELEELVEVVLVGVRVFAHDDQVVGVRAHVASVDEGLEALVDDASEGLGAVLGAHGHDVEDVVAVGGGKAEVLLSGVRKRR